MSAKYESLDAIEYNALTANCWWLVALEVCRDDLNGLTRVEAGWCLLLHYWRVA